MAHGYTIRAFAATYAANGADPPSSGATSFQYLGAIRGKVAVHRATVEEVEIEIQEGTAPFADFTHSEKCQAEFDLTYCAVEQVAFFTGRGGANPYDPTTDAVTTTGTVPNIDHTLNVGGRTNTLATYYQFGLVHPTPNGMDGFDRYFRAKGRLTKPVEYDKKDIASCGIMFAARWDPSAATAISAGIGQFFDNDQPV